MLALGWRARGLKIASVANVGYAASGAALVLVPWIAIYGPETASVLWPLAQTDVKIPPFSAIAGILPEDWPRLFSTAAFFYGASFAAYGVALSILAVVAVVAFIAVRRSEETALLGLVSGALAVATLFSVVVLSYATDFNSVLRFVSPVLAAALAVSAIWIGRPSRRAWIAAAVTAPALVCAVFAQNLLARINGALEARSLIAFAAARSDNYLLFLGNALGPDYRAWIAGLQARIPERETILAWTSVSFLMDYGRNPILVFSPQGYHHPLLNFPFPSGQPAETTAALKRLGVRYIVWEYAGYTTRSEAYYQREADSRFAGLRRINYSLLRMQVYLKGIAQRTRPVFADSRMAIFDVASIPD